MSGPLYLAIMSSEERSAWIMGVVGAGSLAVYLAVVLGRLDGGHLADVSYVAPMLWTVGGSIVASILLHIGAGIIHRGDGHLKDQRDREIGRRGDYIGQSFLVIGGLAALGMAMAQWPYFWIANVIYLGFHLSAIVGSAAKLAAYRRGFAPW
jgi:hypothetical protein